MLFYNKKCADKKIIFLQITCCTCTRPTRNSDVFYFSWITSVYV